MPKYVNSSTSIIDVDGVRFDPGESKTIYSWLTSLPTGLTKLSDDPYFNPGILSYEVSGTSTIDIPTTVTGSYKVRIYVSAGSVTIRFNSSSGVGMVIGAGDAYEVKCLNRIVNDVRFTISSGTAYITVEKI